MFEIHNREYTSYENELMDWINEVLSECCIGNTFFDLFGGTGIVPKYLIDKYDNYIINDLLHSNEVIYKGFFMQKEFDFNKLEDIKLNYAMINKDFLGDNYVSLNYGNKFFELKEAKLIGYIRQDIEDKYKNNYIREKEYYILLASLLYSIDKVTNNLGDYKAYLKNKENKYKFEFDLINPIKLKEKQSISIYRKDVNELVKEVNCDIAFLNLPYSSHQYSRYNDVLENITKCEKSELYEVDLKPDAKNTSDCYGKFLVKRFKDLINSLDTKYIAVIYNLNNNSFEKEITLKEIEEILTSKGETKKFEQSHKEILFITKVK